MFRATPTVILLGLVSFFSACHTSAVQKEIPATEPYISDPHSVGFDIAPLPAASGTRRWMATYSDQGKAARFIIELTSSKPMASEPGVDLDMSSGQGAIEAVPASDASTMLPALAKALEAKHLPKHVSRVTRLPFEYVILGDHNSQASDGSGFSAKPPGNWTAMKIFLGKGGEDEVFLNFNAVTRKAQFSEKDIDYGDPLVADLAAVL